MSLLANWIVVVITLNVYSMNYVKLHCGYSILSISGWFAVWF